MRGDVINVEDHHRRAAETIVALLADEVVARTRRTTISVAGESGSGKSEMGAALVEAFGDVGIGGVVLGQDDYFVLPPRSNDQVRREDIRWVGPREVQLDLLDEHLAAARSGAPSLHRRRLPCRRSRRGPADQPGRRL